MTIKCAPLALFPLHTVLFPGGLLPLQIFEARYVDLVSECLRNGHGFGVVAIRDGREAGLAALPHQTGTLAEISDWHQGDNGLLNLVVRGTQRFRIHTHSVAGNQLVTAEVEWIAPPAVIATTSEYTELRALLNKLLEHGGAIDSSSRCEAMSNAEVAYRIAEMLPLSTADKTALLELADDHQLLSTLQAMLSRIFAQRSSNH